ncbi:MAG TPA: M15 family metallopeptidase [Terracidiphilus sp.]|nr:M15 family metallopeptidase [Terracidiphilus sp.]
MTPSRLRKASIPALAAVVLFASLAGAQSTPGPSSPASSLVAGAKSHLFGGQYDPRSPAAAPAPLRPEWADYIGEYGWELGKFYVVEDGGELNILAGWFDFETIHPISADVFKLPLTGPHGAQTVTFQRDTAHAVTGVEIAGVVYKKRPFDTPGQVFHITPLKPVAELRKDALASTPPAEPGNFRKPNLVELNKLDPTIKLDVRYATSRNFLGSPLYLEPRAYMQRPAAEAVVRASQRLRQLGYGLLIHDSYRPWYVTKMFWEGTPPEKRIFVANPAKGSRHNRGCAVDLTLYNLKTGEPIRMTGGYDEMSERSYPFYPGGTSRERWHRDLLRHVMEADGFTVNESEWWHFDYKDWNEYPILNLTFEQLENSKP